jgi:hypothetical protein
MLTGVMTVTGNYSFLSSRFCFRFSKDGFHGLEHRQNSRSRLATHSESAEFCNFIEQKYNDLDILINNAAQTVRRPAGFYTHMMANEEFPGTLPQHAQGLLLDHNCLDAKSVDIWRFHLMKICPLLGTDQNLVLVWASAKLSQILPFDNALVAQKFFPKENSMPTCNK